MIGNVDKLLQGRGVTEVSEMKAETFSQHLDREKKEHIGSERVENWDITCVLDTMRGHIEQYIQQINIHKNMSNVNVTTWWHTRLISFKLELLLSTLFS